MKFPLCNYTLVFVLGCDFKFCTPKTRLHGSSDKFSNFAPPFSVTCVNSNSSLVLAPVNTLHFKIAVIFVASSLQTFDDALFKIQ